MRRVVVVMLFSLAASAAPVPDGYRDSYEFDCGKFRQGERLTVITKDGKKSLGYVYSVQPWMLWMGRDNHISPCHEFRPEEVKAIYRPAKR